MSQPFKLFRLQQLDSQIDRAKARLKEIEAILSNDEQLNQARAQSEQMNSALLQARRLLRQAEDNVQQQRVKIEQIEASLYGGKVRNPKELQDLQNDAAALKRFRSTLEDRQLEAMEIEEAAQAAAIDAATQLDGIQFDLIKRNQDLLIEQTRLQQEIGRTDQERQAAAETIPSEDLALYDHLRRQRRGVAVSKITNKACSACGSTLNAALLDAARSPNQLNRCDMCGRILYLG